MKKKKKRHKPSGQRRICTRLRISEPLEETANTATHSPRRESTRTEQVVLTPTGHDVAKINKCCQPPMPGVFLKDALGRNKRSAWRQPTALAGKTHK